MKKQLQKTLACLFYLFLLCFSVESIAQNIFGGEPVQVVGQMNGYSTASSANSVYRRVSITTGNPNDCRGQWMKTYNAQSSGGDVLNSNMAGGGGNGFLFISGPSSGGNCGGRFNNKWVFSGVGQAALGAINGISQYSNTCGGTDMGLNMSTAGRYTFVFNDAGYTQTNAKFYVGYTANAPVTVTRSGQSYSGTQPVITITTSAAPSSGENIYVRYRVGTNDFTSSTSIVQATGSGTSWSATLPSQSCGTTLYYYVYTSTRSFAQVSGDNDQDRTLATLRYDDNSGSNFSTTLPTAITYYQDADGDGFGNASATQLSCTGVPSGYVSDNSDCNDAVTYYTDSDGDGFGILPKLACGSVTNNTDCNDSQAQYQDLDGDGFGNLAVLVGCGVTNSADCNDSQLQYQDSDGDGFGNPTVLVGCGVANNTDCNDSQAQFQDLDNDGFGSNVLVACGVTNSTDCNDNQLQYLDADGDGFGNPAVLVACGATNNADCNDSQAQFQDLDNDGFGSNVLVACGVTNSSDCNDNQLQYQDVDGDGFGNPNVLVACGATNNSDCNDNQAQFQDLDGDGFGSIVLVACGVTNSSDCNDNQLQYQDADGDGFGNPAVLVACGATNNADCNDSQAQFQDLDNDGFGSNVLVACGVTNSSDCNDNQLQYQDADGDGFGNPSVLVACGAINNSDCNDSQAQFQDLDGDGFGSNVLVGCGVTNSSDCNDAVTYYTDNDGDGFGTLPKIACGTVTNSTDCNDGDISAWQTGTFYVDADGDNYSPTPTTTQTLCYGATEPAGYSLAAHSEVDCNDAVASIYPGATEICYNNILENCSGTLSQGCAPVVVNMTPSYNNTTLASLSTAIPAVVYTYPGASNIKYRFSIKNVTTNVTSADIIQTSRYVTIPAALHLYGAAYDIKVSAVINDEVVAYAGNTIRVNGPTVQLITLNSATCGATLATLASTLTANAGLNATGYTFRIRLNDSNPTPTYYTSPSATRFVSANSFTGFPLQYATSYKVSVQYTFTDPVTSLPVDSGYGSECTINTPSIPLTTLASPTCGSQVATLNANISAAAASYATGYQFRIRLFADNGPTPGYNYTIPNASRFSSLKAFQEFAIAYNTSYSISVQYSVLNGATTVWSGYGPECKITTPSHPVTSLVPSQCGLATPTSLTQQLNITPYPGFPNYMVKLEELSGEDVVNSQEKVVVYSHFKLSDFSLAQLGKNYAVSVAIILPDLTYNTGYVYDTACDLFTPAPGKTAMVVPFKAVAYPNPFANNFNLEVKTSSNSNVNLKVYDMVGRLIDQRDVRVSDMETTTIGDRYPNGVYNVVVSQEDSVQTVRVVKR